MEIFGVYFTRAELGILGLMFLFVGGMIYLAISSTRGPGGHDRWGR